ncbi:MAG: hypothetical protein Q4B86_07105 [Eubacteriales bacterium]|nr:hypothetical protein [Eubacteriales bacterium]
MLEVYKNLLTTEGTKLHATTLNGGKMQFTRFEIGDGIYTGTEKDDEIVSMTSLKSVKKSYGITGISIVNENTCRLALVATNEGILTGFYVTEIAIYAKPVDGDEILYAIIIAKPDTPEWMSPYNEAAPGSLRYYDFISVGNASNITIAPGGAGILSTDEISSLEDVKNYLFSDSTTSIDKNSLVSLEGLKHIYDKLNDYTDIHGIIDGTKPKKTVLHSMMDAVGVWLAEKVITHTNFADELRKRLVNNGTATLEGYALDARQANPNITGSLAQQISQLNEETAGAHNSIYRGKFLGNTVTSAQYEAISSGKFTDLYIGDYWTIGGVNYRIGAFDYYLNCGDTNTTRHHAVIVPDTSLYDYVMNDTNTTEGAYVGSKMYKEGLTQAKNTIKAAFNGHILKHRVYLTKAAANGKPTDGGWYDSEVDLMCEEMVYGSGIFHPVSDGANIPANYRVEKSQLPLFAHEPSRIINRTTWWLRDIAMNSYFAAVNGHGFSAYDRASNSISVRPAFCIC